MSSRIIVGLSGILLLIFIFLKGNISFLLFTMLVIALSLFELYNMFSKKNIKVYYIYGLVCSLLIPINTYFKLNLDYKIIIYSFIILTFVQIITTKINKGVEKFSYTFFGIIYIAVLFNYIIKLLQLPYGREMVLFSFILIWTCDTFAYISGVLLGKHKFSIISPNKSIEGLIGAFIAVIIVSKYFNYIYYYLITLLSKIPFMNIEINYIPIFNNWNFTLIIFSLLITLFAVMGDLFESKIKREFGVKDSSNLLLGHGGFLDRFDSALFVIPLIYTLYPYIVR